MFEKFMNLDTERRESIINAALKEFAKKGYDDASTNVMAKEADISKALMFHYVKSKKDFFLFLYDYSIDLLNKEYFEKINLEEKDIFNRLKEAYLLKIKVLDQYPWIFDFIKVTVLTDSEAVNEELYKRRKKIEGESFDKYYGDIDLSNFREGLNVEKSKQLIFWAIGGYAAQVLEEVRHQEVKKLDYEKIRIEFEGYLTELRKTFYK